MSSHHDNRHDNHHHPHIAPNNIEASATAATMIDEQATQRNGAVGVPSSQTGREEPWVAGQPAVLWPTTWSQESLVPTDGASVAAKPSPASSTRSASPPSDAQYLPAKHRKSTSTRRSSTINSSALKNLHPYDVLCGRCTACFNNAGNRRFRLSITANVSAYSAANSKADKGIIIQSIIQNIEQAGGRFMRPKADGRFVLLDDSKVRGKVGHALRDLSVMTTTQKERKWFKSLSGPSSSSSRPCVDNDQSTASAASPSSSHATQKHRITAPTGSDTEQHNGGGQSQAQKQNAAGLSSHTESTRSFPLSHKPATTVQIGYRRIRQPPTMPSRLMNSSGASPVPNITQQHSASGKIFNDDDFAQCIDQLINFCSSDEDSSEPLPINTKMAR